MLFLYLLGLCNSEDPEMMEKKEKSYTDLLREELSLRTNMTKDKLEHADSLTREMNKISSHFKKRNRKVQYRSKTL